MENRDMSMNHNNLEKGGRYLRTLKGLMAGIVAVAMFCAVNASAQTDAEFVYDIDGTLVDEVDSSTISGVTLNVGVVLDGSNTGYWDSSSFMLISPSTGTPTDGSTSYNLTGDISIIATGGANAILTTHGTSDVTFDLGGNITITGAGAGNRRGFYYLAAGDTNFAATILGDNCTISVTADSGDAMGVYFLKSSGSTEAKINGADIHFGTITATSSTGGAYGFAAGEVMTGSTIQLDDVSAITGSGVAVAALFHGGVAENTLFIGDLTASSNIDATGLLNRDGGDLYATINGTVDVTATTGGWAAGIRVLGPSVGNAVLNLEGAINATATGGTAYGILVDNGNATITLTGNLAIDAQGQDDARSRGIQITSGNLTIDLAGNNLTSTSTKVSGAVSVTSATAGTADLGKILGNSLTSLSIGTGATVKVAADGANLALGGLDGVMIGTLNGAGTLKSEDALGLGTVTGNTNIDTTGSTPTPNAHIAFLGNAALGTVKAGGSNVVVDGAARNISATSFEANGHVNNGVNDVVYGLAVVNSTMTGPGTLATGSQITVGTGGITATGGAKEAIGFGAGSIANNATVTVTGQITATSDAYAFGVNVAGSSAGNFELGAVSATGASAAGLRFDGPVTGTLSTTGDITATASGGDAIGVHVVGGTLGTGANTNLGAITATNASGDAYGIWISDDGSIFTLKNNVTATSTSGGDGYGVLIENGNADITIDGVVSVTGTTSSFQVANNLELTVNAAKSLTTGEVNTGGNFNLTNAGTTTLSQGASITALNNAGGTLNVNGDTTVTNTVTNGGAINVASSKTLTLTNGGTIGTLGGTGNLTASTGPISIGNTTGTFSGAVTATTGDVDVTAGTFGGAVTATNDVNITAGTFNGAVTATTGDVNITAGTFNSGAAVTATAGSVNITNGTFNSTIGAGTDVVITAGTFNQAITADGDITANGGTYSGNLTAGNDLNLNGGTYSGNLAATTTTVKNGATLTPGSGTQTVTGNLVLNNATIAVSVATGNLSGKLAVTGDVTINTTAPGSTTIINFASFVEGTYTILTAANTLTGNDTDFSFLVGGVAGGSRQSVVFDVDTVTKTVKATLSLTSAGNIDLTWNNGTAWRPGNNWLDGTTATEFTDGDRVTFNKTGTPSIGVSGDILVADMTVKGGGTFTFTGTGGIKGVAYDSAVGATNFTTLTDATGKLVVTESSKVIFTNTGPNTFVSTTVDTGSTLQIGNGGTTGSIAGDIVNDGNVTFNRSDNVIFSSEISGMGTLTKLGAGTLTLTEDNTYTGTTTVNGGKLILTGDNDTTNVVVNAGTLQIGADGVTGGPTGSVAGDIDIASGANVVFNRTGTVIVNEVSGTGTLTLGGGGTYDLDTNNTLTTFAGSVVVNGSGTMVSGGNVGDHLVLDAGTYNATDDLDLVSLNGTGGTLRVNGVSLTVEEGIFNGIITGVSNTLTKDGTGTLTLNGATTVDETKVKAGKLLVGGAAGSTATLDGDVNVLNTATLGGHGTINGNLIVQNGGTLSPGNSIGTIIVNGDVTFNGNSTYLYEIDQTNSDLLDVPSGNVIIEYGANLKVEFLNGHIAADNDEFQVIAVTDSSIQFDPAKQSFAITNPWGGSFTEDIRTSGYWIIWAARIPDFAAEIKDYASPNAINAAVAMDTIGSTGGVDDLYRALSGMPSNDPQALANAFAQLHGEVFATSVEAAAQQQRQFVQLLPNGRELYNQQQYPQQKLWNRWGTLTGNMHNRQKIDRYSAYDLGSVGVAFGVDRMITTNTLFGVAGGYDYAEQEFKGIQSSAQISGARAMLYGSWYNGTYYVDTYGGYTKNFYKTERNINIGNSNSPFAATAKGSYDDNMGSAGLEFGRVWQAWGNVFTPSIGMHAIWRNSPDVTETGGVDANLFVKSDDYVSLRVPVGVKMSRVFFGGHNTVWVPEFRAVYTAELMDDSASVTAAFNNVPTVSFASESGKWGSSSGRLGLGLGVFVANHVSVRLDYDHAVYNHTNVGIFSGTLGVQW